jgi:ABC-type transport system substrate-binding protein
MLSKRNQVLSRFYDSQAASVLRGEYEGLVMLRGASTTAIEGALAVSWTSSAGHKVYTFHLRHGITFPAV